MGSRFEQARIGQLLGDYAPQAAPQHPLDFGDYLSLLWRFDQCATFPVRARYYRSCIIALGRALEIDATPLGRLVASVSPGFAYDELPNLPYRAGERLVDARDRKAATTARAAPPAPRTAARAPRSFVPNTASRGARKP